MCSRAALVDSSLHVSRLTSVQPFCAVCGVSSWGELISWAGGDEEQWSSPAWFLLFPAAPLGVEEQAAELPETQQVAALPHRCQEAAEQVIWHILAMGSLELGRSSPILGFLCTRTFKKNLTCSRALHRLKLAQEQSWGWDRQSVIVGLSLGTPLESCIGSSVVLGLRWNISWWLVSASGPPWSMPGFGHPGFNLPVQWLPRSMIPGFSCISSNGTICKIRGSATHT